MTADPAPPRGGSTRRLPLLTLVAGGFVLGYGLVILAPVVPTAAWNGVVDSASVRRMSRPPLPGRRPVEALTLFFRGTAVERTMSLPGSPRITAASLQAGDTVHALAGWRTFQATAVAVSLLRGESVLLDSAAVLRDERNQRNRAAVVGSVLLALGLVGIVRGARRGSAEPPAPVRTHISPRSTDRPDGTPGKAQKEE
jgi:hypothetical protein